MKKIAILLSILFSANLFASSNELQIHLKNIRGVDEKFRLTSELHEQQLLFHGENYKLKMKSGIVVEYKITQDGQGPLFFEGRFLEGRRTVLKEFKDPIKGEGPQEIVFDNQNGHMVVLKLNLVK